MLDYVICLQCYLQIIASVQEVDISLGGYWCSWWMLYGCWFSLYLLLLLLPIGFLLVEAEEGSWPSLSMFDRRKTKSEWLELFRFVPILIVFALCMCGSLMLLLLLLSQLCIPVWVLVGVQLMRSGRFQDLKSSCTPLLYSSIDIAVSGGGNEHEETIWTNNTRSNRMIIVYCSPFYHGAMMSEEVDVDKNEVWMVEWGSLSPFFVIYRLAIVLAHTEKRKIRIMTHVAQHIQNSNMSVVT